MGLDLDVGEDECRQWYQAWYEFMRVLLDHPRLWNHHENNNNNNNKEEEDGSGWLFRGIGIVHQLVQEYSHVVDLSRVISIPVDVRGNGNDSGANANHDASCGEEDGLELGFASSSSSSLLGLLMNFFTRLPNLHLKFVAHQTRQRYEILKSNVMDRTQANILAEECAVEANGTFHKMLRQIRYILWHLYVSLNERRRMVMRRRLGCYLNMFGGVGSFSNTKDVTGLSEVLSVVQDIVVVSVLPSHAKEVELVERDLAMNLLVPLFSNNCLSRYEFALYIILGGESRRGTNLYIFVVNLVHSWRDQQCTLASYYAALSKLIITIVSRKPICKDSNSNFANEIFESIANSSSSSIWPKNIHTGKLILILCMVQVSQILHNV